MDYFFDQHFHLMDISHPNLISFFGSIESGVAELFTSGLLPSYILTPKTQDPHPAVAHHQHATTFAQPIGVTLLMMEDDLSAPTLHDEEALYPKTRTSVRASSTSATAATTRWRCARC